MSTYRKARFGDAGLYEMPKVEFTADEIAEILKAVALPAASIENLERDIFPKFLRDIAQWYFVAASQLTDAPTKTQLKEYVGPLNDALERLYQALGANRKIGLVAGVGTLPDRQAMFHPEWDAHRELMALCAQPGMQEYGGWFQIWANLAPDMAADRLADGEIERIAAQGVLDNPRILARALAGVDALAAIAQAGREVVDRLPDSKGGRPTAKEEQNFLFTKLAGLYRKTYGEEPLSTRSGEEFKGTWHDWLEAILPKIGAKLADLRLKDRQIPKDTWREAAWVWLNPPKPEKP